MAAHQNGNGQGNGAPPAPIRRRYGRDRAPGQVAQDPAAAVRAVAPPNLGRDFIPHVITFQGRLSTVSNVYRNPDEAYKDNVLNARIMRKSLVVEECLEGRKLATALLNWHLEPVDEEKEDPDVKALVDGLTAIVSKIPRFTMYRFALLDAIWAGRQAAQHKYAFRRDPMTGKQQTIISGWKPIHGDKLAFRYDDGTGKYSDDDIGIRVGPTFYTGDVIAGDRRIEITDYGPAYFLEDWERSMLAVHRHIIEDGWYEDPLSAGRIHGVGIRDRIYWTWLQMQEALAQLMEAVERTGNGTFIYWYPDGNAEAKTRAEQVAGEQAHTNYIIMPRDPTGAETYGVDYFPANTAGIEALRTIIHEYFGHQIKRYILGQTLTSEAQATGLGSNVADMHHESLMRIRDFDAVNLEETLSAELIGPLKHYNAHLYRRARDIDIRFKIDTDSAESDKKLDAAYRAWEMGLEIKDGDIRNLTGLSEPGKDDKVLANPNIQQQQRLWEQAHDPNAAAAGAPEGSPQDMFGPLAGGAPPEGGEGEQPPQEGGPGPEGPPPGPQAAGPEQYKRKPAPGQKSIEWDEEKHPRGQPENAGQFATSNQAGGKIQHLLKEGGKEIGEVSTVPRPDSHHEVSNLLVWPEHQGKGHASRMLEHAARHLQAQGKKLFASTDLTEDAKKLQAKLREKGHLTAEGEYYPAAGAAAGDHPDAWRHKPATEGERESKETPEEPFDLKRESDKAPPKPAEFDNSEKGKQKAMLAGMDLNPDVRDLFDEWGHFFDHSLQDFQGDKYASEQTRHRKGLEGIHGAMAAAVQSIHDSGYGRRLREALGHYVSQGLISERKASDYWEQGREVFARTFERYIQHKLESAGRQNTYLAGLEYEGAERSDKDLWPTQKEIEEIAPAFDELFNAYRGTLKK